MIGAIPHFIIFITRIIYDDPGQVNWMQCDLGEPFQCSNKRAGHICHDVDAEITS